MGKKAKSDIPNPNSVANRDIIQRMNFLFQASVYLHSLGDTARTTDAPQTARPQPKKTPRSRAVSTADLARTYVRSMKIVGKKTLAKLDPAVKRTICQCCATVLLPGSTATVRIKASSTHGHVISYTCNACSVSRRIPTPPTPEHSQMAEQCSADTSAPGQPSTEPLTTPGAVPLNALETRIAQRKRRRKLPHARLPPLFARDVGHVIFRGNEILENSE